jgi:uncharacterized protein (TIGR03437 family)
VCSNLGLKQRFDADRQLKGCHRAVVRGILFFLTVSSSFAQQYVLSTLAGGSPPPTPAVATSDSIYPPNGIAVDSSGNIFFASFDCVFRLTGATVTRVAGNAKGGYSGDGGPATNAQMNVGFGLSGSILTLDPAGNLYVADIQNFRVRKISTSGIITTVAGNGGSLPSGDGGPAVNAALGANVVAFDGVGNLFIASGNFGIVRKVSPNGIISTVAGGGSAPVTNGAQATSVTLFNPTGLAIDASGNLFISDTGNNSIREVSPAGFITTIAGTGTPGFSGDGGPATAAQLDAPGGLVFDAAGNLIVADSLNNRIRKISGGGVITTIAGGGTVYPGNAVQATQASLFRPLAVTIDSVGNLYVAAGWIQKIATDGTISILAGNGTYNFSGDGGAATMAQLWEPQDVAIDSSGNVFISDQANFVVRRVDTQGTITTVAGNGTCGNPGDGGAAILASLCYPAGLAIDSAGNLYIADSTNNRIRRVSLGGTISTVAGNGDQGFSGDGGPAASATLNNPLGVAVDGAGNLFIADYANNRVRKVSTTGIITTVAGTGAFGFSGDGGQATSAQLAAPWFSVLDQAGNLFIADVANARVRKVSPDGVITTVAGNGGEDYPGDGSLAVNVGILVQGVALDAAGNLFVSGGFEGVFQVSGDGTIKRVAGNGQFSTSGDGVPASSASVSAFGLRVDPTGRIYLADGISSVRMLQPVNQAVLVGAVVDAASESAIPVSPGKIVAVYGAGLGPAQLVSNQPQNGVFPTQLAGTTVSFNGIPGPLLYTSSTQVAAIVPYELTGTAAQVTVGYQGNVSPAFSVPVAASAPSIFSSNGTGAGQAAAVNGDGSLNDAAHPVAVGGYLSLYVTGEGQTTPQGVDGKVAPNAPPFPQPQLGVTASVGGQPASISYAGAAPGEVAGLMQVVLQIPAGVQPGGYVPVVVQVGGASTIAGAAWIAVSSTVGAN